MEIGLALRLDWLGLRPAWLALGPSRGGMDVRMNERTYGKSPHSTGLRPLSGPLPRKVEKEEEEGEDQEIENRGNIRGEFLKVQ